MYKGLKLKDFKPIDNMTKEERKEFRKFAKEYYRDYLQGTSVNRNGNILFTNRGESEISRWNPKQAKNFPEIKKDLKNAIRLENKPNKVQRKQILCTLKYTKEKMGNILLKLINKVKKDITLQMISSTCNVLLK
ncbi:MAG: hypothetical protein ACI37R_00575 [Candidatus Avigastranaerophilus sp.]